MRQHTLGVWILSSLVLLFSYNNCGPVTPPTSSSVSSSSTNDDHPWPNSSTTLKGSNQFASQVTFGDFDNNSFEDAAFVSVSPDQRQVVLRVVRSGSFTEQFNIINLPSRPSLGTRMIFEDLDMNSSYKELIYLNAQRTHVVAVDLSAPVGRIRFNMPLAEPLGRVFETDFRLIRMAQGRALEIGSNLIFYGPSQSPSIASGSSPLDGGWSEWSDWHRFGHGGLCSKTCGDGIEIRNRSCSSPAPRSGGQNCPMESPELVCAQSSGYGSASSCAYRTNMDFVGSVHTKACRLRDCQESECGSNEVFNNGSCDAIDGSDGGSRSGGGSGGGGGGLVGGGDGGGSGGGGSGGGGSGGGSGGFQDPTDCASSEIWDPAFSQCTKAYPASDIFLTSKETRYLGEGETEVIDHTYRLSVNHSKTIAQRVSLVADEYCRFLGHDTAVSFQTASYIVGADPTQDNALSAYVLCNQAVNGMYNRCQVRGGPQDYVRFSYTGVTYQPGQQVQYLKSVICRKFNNSSTGNPQGTVF